MLDVSEACSRSHPIDEGSSEDEDEEEEMHEDDEDDEEGENPVEEGENLNLSPVPITESGVKYFPTIPSDDQPYVGKIFNCSEDALTFYNNYARLAGFSTKLCSSLKSKDGTGYRSRTFSCSREGTTNLIYQLKEKHKKPRSGYRKRGRTRCFCDARLTVKRVKDGNAWMVSKFSAGHAHPLTSPARVELLTSHRNVTPAQKSLLDQFTQANIRTCQLYRFMEAQKDGSSSIGCQERDIRNAERERRQKKLGHDADTLVKYFECEKEIDENYYYSIKTERGVLDKCFWADSTSRSAYAYFGDVIVFDTTYNTNMYGMILAPFIGVNHHRQTVLFTCGLLSNEKIESFKWLFSQFLESMPTGAAPKVIITDQDQAIGRAVREVFPHTEHRFCLWHITNKFSEKLGPTFYGAYHGVLSAIVHNSETPDQFEKKWGGLMSSTPLGANEWLRSMYAIRDRWVLAYVKHLFAAGMTSSQRVESHHSFLKTYVIRKNSLSDFIVQFKYALRHQRHLELQAEHIDKLEVPILLTHHPMEIQMRTVYTKALFSLFQDELLQSLHYDIKKSSSTEDAKVYEVLRSDAGSDRSRNVTWNTGSDIIVACSCKLFEFAGYLCRHILCLLQRKGVKAVPEYYILNRWGKHAKSVPVFESIPASLPTVSTNSPRDNMITEFVSLANEVSSLPAVQKFVMEGFNELRRQSREMMAREGPIGASSERVQVDGIGVEEGLHIQDPVSVRAKGSGKRIQSSKEKAMSQSGRKCRICKQSGHNAKTCSKNNARTILVDEDYHPVMSDVDVGVGNEASPSMVASLGGDNNFTYPTSLPGDAWLE